MSSRDMSLLVLHCITCRCRHDDIQFRKIVSSIRFRYISGMSSLLHFESRRKVSKIFNANVSIIVVCRLLMKYQHSTINFKLSKQVSNPVFTIKFFFYRGWSLLNKKPFLFHLFHPDILADIGPKMGAEIAKPTRASP